MTCSQSYVKLMHKFLDGDITQEEEQQLRVHLRECSECQNHFQELKKTIAYVQSTSHIHTPSTFTETVIANLPKEKSTAVYKRWFTSHPLLVAVSTFTIIMGGSLFSAWHSDTHLSVSKQANLEIQEQTVIVPEGVVVEGDVIVRNGDIKIEGEVHGNVVVINGDKYLASAGHVTGEIEEIDQIYGWMWYHTKKFLHALFQTE